MKSKLFLWSILLLIPVMVFGEGSNETIVVSEAGTLRELVASLESVDIRQLTIKGSINSADIKFLREQTGRLVNLEVLDLKDVTLVPSEEPYYTFSIKNMEGWSTKIYEVCISDHTSSTYLGVVSFAGYGATTKTRIDSDCLAYAFTGMNLKKVVLPQTFNRLAEGIFKGCGYLEDVEASDAVQFVDDEAFSGCSNLKSLNLSSQLCSIGIKSFYQCTSLVNIGTLSQVENLGANAFCGCTSFKGTNNGELDITSLDSISDGAFRECSFAKIRFSSNLNEIGQYAFRSCKQLTFIQLPQSIERIGSSAFADCTKLAEVTLPNDLGNIEEAAFNNTPWYNSLQPVNNVIYIGNVADKIKNTPSAITIREGTVGISSHFASGAERYLMKVQLSSTLRHIGNSAFENCKYISKIELPDQMKSIGDAAFDGCTNLSEANMPESLESIGGYAFRKCPLKSVELSKNINEIGWEAFYDNKSLISVSYNVPKVDGVRIFGTCSGLEKVIIGPDVREIPEGIFEKCSNLLRVEFEERANGENLTIGEGAFLSCANLDYFNFVSAIDSISDSAFNGCKLTTLIIPEGIKIIESSAFANCKTETLTLPSTLEKVDDSAFYNLSNLKTLNYNLRLATIDFSNNKSIEKVTVGPDVQQIRGFAGCTNLKDLIFEPRIANNELLIGYQAFYRCESLGNLSLPEGTTSIGSSAFEGCNSITSLSLPTTLQGIGAKAFYEAFIADGSFEELRLPHNIKHIGDYAFAWNVIKKIYYNIEETESAHRDPFSGSYLTEVVIGKHVRRIKSYMFYNSSFSKLSAEERTEEDPSLSYCSFASCSIGTVNFPEKTDSIYGLPSANVVCIPESVSYLVSGVSGDATIGDMYFNARNAKYGHINQCERLIIGKNVESIPSSLCSYGKIHELLFESRDEQSTLDIGYQAFYSIDTFRDCSVKLPQGTRNIASYAFSFSKINRIDLPSTVTSIGQFAFNTNHNSGLAIYNYQQEPLMITNDLMVENNYSKATLYVPNGAKEKYQSSNIWKKFTIREFDAGYTDIETTADERPEISSKSVYSIDGKQLSCPQRGLNIIRMSDGTTKKVVKK